MFTAVSYQPAGERAGLLQDRAPANCCHGDWDADGDDTVGLYQTSIGVYFVKNSNDPGNSDTAFPYGAGSEDWIHLSGDRDGDGHDTVGAYKKGIGVFFLKNSNAPGNADIMFQYGPGGNDLLPVVGRWV